MNIGRPLDREMRSDVVNNISLLAFNKAYDALDKPIFMVLRNTIFTSSSTITNNNYGLRR